MMTITDIHFDLTCWRRSFSKATVCTSLCCQLNGPDQRLENLRKTQVVKKVAALVIMKFLN